MFIQIYTFLSKFFRNSSIGICQTKRYLIFLLKKLFPSKTCLHLRAHENDFSFDKILRWDCDNVITDLIFLQIIAEDGLLPKIATEPWQNHSSVYSWICSFTTIKFCKIELPMMILPPHFLEFSARTVNKTQNSKKNENTRKRIKEEEL